MIEIDQKEWNLLLKSITDLCEWFPDGLVMIGGVAVYLHSTQQQKIAPEFSHDGDFYLSLNDYADLRDIEEVTQNKRPGKSQIIKNGFDFDIYVERHNDLVVDYDDILIESTTINGVRCACLEHLLILKIDAYLDRKGSRKGDKDERDIVKVISLLDQPKILVLDKYLTEERLSAVESILNKQSVFFELANNNSFKAKEIKGHFQDNFDFIKNEILTKFQPE